MDPQKAAELQKRQDTLKAKIDALKSKRKS
jgi:hypothetical protein